MTCSGSAEKGMENLTRWLWPNGMRSLSGLLLSGTQVTATGLGHLKGLARLEALHVGKTQVTMRRTFCGCMRFALVRPIV